MKFEKGEIVYCINESSYSLNLTKRQRYQVVETKDGLVRLKGKQNRLVWIPNYCFSKTKQPNIYHINIDDEIENPHCDSIEITISFEDNTKGWFTIMTPNYIENNSLKNVDFYLNLKTVFVKEISEKIIKESIYEFDRSNELIGLLNFFTVDDRK